jgi:hypothetical protein
MNPAPLSGNCLWFGPLIQALDEPPTDGVLIETDSCGCKADIGESSDVQKCSTIPDITRKLFDR